MTYVDGFVIPLKKKDVAAYRRIARIGAKMWKKAGALDYKECVADDLAPTMGGQKVPPMFPKMAKLKRGETLIFSFIVFKSRAHRDRVNAKVMKDPAMAAMGDPADMPVDMNRMAFAGFKTIVEW